MGGIKMALITSKDFSELKRFELNVNQLKILFSLEYLITKEDVARTKGQKRFAKRQWLQSWSASIHDYLGAIDSTYTRQFYNLNDIKQAVNKELVGTPGNKTWYPIVILEATLFIPYTELRRNKADDKEYGKLRFTKQTKYIKSVVEERGIINEEDVDRFEKVYKKVLFELRGAGPKIIVSIGAVLAVTSLAGKVAALTPGPIAASNFGAGFVGLKGAALTSAALAAAGGGAIAVGGAGMAGDVAAIAGGGALLGLAVSGAEVGTMNLLIASSPDFTLLQAARLEVVVREIILNKQRNVVLAQDILQDYAEQIKKLHKYIQVLELKDEASESKRNIKDLTKSLKHMQKTYININTFTSCFNIGMENN